MLVYTTTDSLGGLHNTCGKTFEAAILGGFHFAKLYDLGVSRYQWMLIAEVNPRGAVGEFRVNQMVSTCEEQLGSLLTIAKYRYNQWG